MTSDPVYEATCGAMAELVAHGITHVVASPGSRSTPLTVAARWNAGLEISMHLDERSAGFHALGLARATSRPVVLICTSGTAAANYLPAVIEAHYTGVSLLVFTADRPPEFREIGAGQTINQVNLFGGHVRHFAELAVAGEVDAKTHRLAVVRAIDAAMVPRPGPVHLNWPFREPLEPLTGQPDVVASTVLTIAQPARPPAVGDPNNGTLLEDLARKLPRGIIVAGPTPGSLDGADAVLAFSKRSGWPICRADITTETQQ
ncbi:MAG: 2-succinyl-5-enolpyruvyl-6-hydroxy-3-cyclohexene-1-carboxylic-acid synthase [Actinobacteria bacterium]|nr:2-succinyl-5-enolpyruvyl-6-hydroxy-3-cyclohexene-1-carboxylic-acid synthase [Actinomycetota bacterium]